MYRKGKGGFSVPHHAENPSDAGGEKPPYALRARGRFFMGVLPLALAFSA